MIVDGDIYAVWSDRRYGDADIFFNRTKISDVIAGVEPGSNESTDKRPGSLRVIVSEPEMRWKTTGSSARLVDGANLPVTVAGSALAPFTIALLGLSGILR